MTKVTGPLLLVEFGIVEGFQRLIREERIDVAEAAGLTIDHVAAVHGYNHRPHMNRRNGLVFFHIR